MLFSIGKYKDEVHYDIIYIYACQLLFMRPWIFDVDVQHSDRDNAYQIKNKVVKFTLLPLKRRLKPKVTPEESKKTLVAMAQSSQEIKSEFKDS